MTEMLRSRRFVPRSQKGPKCSLVQPRSAHASRLIASLFITFPDGTTVRLADTNPEEIWLRAMRLRGQT
jgi:hypothetical protein